MESCQYPIVNVLVFRSILFFEHHLIGRNFTILKSINLKRL